ARGDRVGAVRDGNRAAAVVSRFHQSVIGGVSLSVELSRVLFRSLGDHRRGRVIDGDRLGAGRTVAAGVGGGVNAADGEFAGATRSEERRVGKGGGHRCAAVVDRQQRRGIGRGQRDGALEGAVGGG